MMAELQQNIDITTIHKPVLFEECVDLISQGSSVQAGTNEKPAVIVDCTLGLGGHTEGFLTRNPNVTVIGIDRDEEALSLAKQRLAPFADRFIPVHSAFDQFSAILDEFKIAHVDAVFMDLGLSSLQIDEVERGFSYSNDAPLDMRMDISQPLTAADILNTYAYDDLVRIMRDWGEEKFASRIANAIIHERAVQPLTHSQALVQLVDRVIPKAKRPSGNPAKRVFQALRIEVNGELDKLASLLPQVALRCSVGGRIVVESYHSLEDTITKRFFANGIHPDIPRDLPIIPEAYQPYYSDCSHGAIMADEAEIQQNSRSSSVRLRAVELTRPLPEHIIHEYREIEHAYDILKPKRGGQRIKRSSQRYLNNRRKR